MKQNTFEIGLVMAGAVSAGAYSAGVMDFLIEALETWYAAKARGEPAPGHDVSIRALSGASAGSMTAAIATAALCSNKYTPVASPPLDPRQLTGNPLFDSWVQRIDICHLLGTRDLDGAGGTLKSLLDSTILDEIARDALRFQAGAKRPYVADELHLLLTVTNLRGVTYNLPICGGDYRGGHDFRIHGDHLHFVLKDGVAPTDYRQGIYYLPRRRAAEDDNWAMLGQAALASGAFPVGLAPRTLSHFFTSKADDPYYQRNWDVPYKAEADLGQLDHCCVCHTKEHIAPRWKRDNDNAPYPGDGRYDFVCVDGGSLNNEPLELTRRLLAEGECQNPRGPEEARRATIMIDPFPDRMEDKPGKDDLFSAIVGLFAAFKNQARFPKEDIALAQSPDIFSRFMIAPMRRTAGGAGHPIASGTLGAFGGFLSQGMRRHDFLLGRKNCRDFLLKHFTLSEHNPLFKDTNGQSLWSEALLATYARDKEGGPYTGSAARYLPIIPVLPDVSVDAALPAWSSLIGRTEAEGLDSPIRRRIQAILNRLADTKLQGLLGKLLNYLLAKPVVWLLKGIPAGMAMKAILENLEQAELIEPASAQASPWRDPSA